MVGARCWAVSQALRYGSSACTMVKAAQLLRMSAMPANEASVVRPMGRRIASCKASRGAI